MLIFVHIRSFIVFIFSSLSMNRTMRNKIIGVLVSGSAILPLMWWNVVPNAADGCVDGASVPVAYSTQQYHTDGTVSEINGTYKYDTKLCKIVHAYPKPVR